MSQECIGSIGLGIAALWPRRYILQRRSMLLLRRGRCLPRFRIGRDPRPAVVRWERERGNGLLAILILAMKGWNI